MRKITSILLSLILMLTCYNVFAAVTVDDASSTVTLSGTLKSGAEGVFIGIDVFCPNMGYEDLREASYGEYKKVIVLRKQIKSEKKVLGQQIFEYMMIRILREMHRPELIQLLFFPLMKQSLYRKSLTI